MTDLEPVTVPALSRLANVELMHAGTWSASTGVHTFTVNDLAFAVAALDCPAVRRPILKLGHTDPRFDGEPAVGWIDNLAVASDGRTLQGDYVGMPGWLGPVLASAYPDRSVEGQWDYRCAVGHEHPFVLTAVALLGVEHPAIGTLESLQDVAQLYGVAASAGDRTGAVSIHLKGGTMPNPKARSVAMGVTAEDVRRAYYDDAPWSVWIEEIQLDPLQLIVIDDDTGGRLRVPVAVSGDGTEGVTFGEAVPVVVRYEDAGGGSDAEPEPEGEAVAASRIRFACRAESRPGDSPRASRSRVAAAAGPTEGGSTVEITDDQLTTLREALGLAEDADLDAIITAVEELATAPGNDAETNGEDTPASVAAKAKKFGLSVMDAATLEARLARGDAAYAQLQREKCERVVDAALSKGKIAPASRAVYLKLMDKDPDGTEKFLAELPDESVVNLSEKGHGVGSEINASKVTDDPQYKKWSL